MSTDLQSKCKEILPPPTSIRFSESDKEIIAQAAKMENRNIANFIRHYAVISAKSLLAKQEQSTPSYQ